MIESDLDNIQIKLDSPIDERFLDLQSYYPTDQSTTANSTYPIGISYDSEDQNNQDETDGKKDSAKGISSGFGVFGINYWQKYFNVDQNEIKDRLIAS